MTVALNQAIYDLLARHKENNVMTIFLICTHKAVIPEKKTKHRVV